MINLIIRQIIILLTVFFLNYSHPLILRSLLIILRLLYGLVIYLTINTPWLCYVLIIVFVSGIIIILIYISRLTSNLILTKKTPIFNICFIILTTLIIWLIFSHKNINIRSLNSISNKQKNHSIEFIYKIYNDITWEITLLLIVYLLILLVASIKIIFKNSSPLQIKK